MRFGLAKYLSRFAPRRQSTSRPPRRGEARQRPALEALEDRLLPSILFSNSGSRNVADGGGNVIRHPDVDLVFWGAG